MKIIKNTRPRGSVLLISLVMVTIILISLASYLTLVSNESQSVTRSQTWNACVPVMEAGVEEAMSQIHQCGIANFSSNNWTLGSDGYYQKTRTMSADGTYYLAEINATNPPTIYCTAYVPSPLSATNYVKRKVRVGTMSSGSSGGGLIAKGTISLSGGATFDSYNSSVGYTAGVHGTNGIAISNTNVAGAINLSGGAIYGIAITGPGGTVTTSGSAAVGDTNWCKSHSGVETNWSRSNANVQFNDVSVPFTSGSIVGSGTYLGTNYTYLLNSTGSPYYYSGNFAVNGGQSMMISGNVTLYVTGQFTTSGSGIITIAPGGSFKLYVGGTCTVSGSGIVNGTGKPSNCAIYGLPTCTTVTYSGSAAYQGTVNAPEADFTFSGSAGAYGAYTAKTILISGSGGVHYDEALGSPTAYLVASWNEVAP